MCLQRGQVAGNDGRVLVLSLEKRTRHAVVAVVGENMLACRVGQSSSRQCQNHGPVCETERWWGPEQTFSE